VQYGGAIAALEDGDIISIDSEAATLQVELSDATRAGRLRVITPPQPTYQRGVHAKYAKSVGSASNGAIAGYL